MLRALSSQLLLIRSMMIANFAIEEAIICHKIINTRLLGKYHQTFLLAVCFQKDKRDLCESIMKFSQVFGKFSMGVTNLKSGGKSSAALGRICL